MKIPFFYFLLICSSLAYSQDEKECEPMGEVEKAGVEINYPCTRSEKLHNDNEGLRSIMSSEDGGTTVEEFCTSCKESKLSIGKKSTTKNFNSENKKQFAKATLNELRKNLSSTMIDLMSLRSTFNLGFKPEESIKACNLGDLALSKCGNGKTLQEMLSETGTDDSFQSIQKQLSYEIANTLDLSPSQGNGLLIRNNENECGIKDTELLHAKMKYWESLITPEVIISLQKTTLKNNEDVLSQLSGPNARILKQASEHPMIQALLKDSKHMNAFIKSFKGDVTQNKITENIFSKSNSEAMAKSLSDRCSTSFETVKKTLCSSDFEKGNVQFDNYDSMRINIGSSLMTESKEENLYTFCQGINTKNNNPLKFSKVNLDLSKDTPPKFKPLDFQTVSTEYYDIAFNSPKKMICSALETQDCDSKLMNCAISKFITAARVKDSPQAQLLASHDPNIDKILGSLIGTAPSVDDKTKIFLTEQGILPKADGSIVESKDNQIRNPRSYASSVKSFEENGGTNPTNIKKVQSNKTVNDDGNTDWTGTKIDGLNNQTGNNATTSKTGKTTSDNYDPALDNNDSFKDKFKQRLNNLKNKVTGNNGKLKHETTRANGPIFPNAATVSGGPLVQNDFVEEGENNVDNNASPLTNTGKQASIDNTPTKRDLVNEAKLNANRKPSQDDRVANTTIALSKTEAGLNQIAIVVPDESILQENTPELEQKIEDFLNQSGQSLQGAKTGEAYFVKLGSFDIKVAINDHGVYVAKCVKECPNLNPEYLKFLSKYFTKIKKGNLRDRLKNTINKIIKKNPVDQTEKTDLE